MLSIQQILVVFGYGLVSALATGLGALPLYFRKQAENFLSIGQVKAAALMTFASFQLLYEAHEYGILLPATGVVAGALLIKLTSKVIARFPKLEELMDTSSSAGARKALLIIVVMTIHSAAEGVGIGVSFGDGRELGTLISLTIALHNIPEGLAISLITVPRGMGIIKSAFWSIGTSMPQPLIGVLAFIFVTLFRPFLPFGLGLAAGAMFWMVGSELLPEAKENLSIPKITITFILSGLIFLGLISLI